MKITTDTNEMNFKAPLFGRDTLTHQVLGIERDIVPPGGDKFIFTVQDTLEHVLIPSVIKERLKPTQSVKQETLEKKETVNYKQ